MKAAQVNTKAVELVTTETAQADAVEVKEEKKTQVIKKRRERKANDEEVVRCVTLIPDSLQIKVHLYCVQKGMTLSAFYANAIKNEYERVTATEQ